jgi:CRISPR/Cas system-associated exonuclease Cas4 (RecB family)
VEINVQISIDAIQAYTTCPRLYWYRETTTDEYQRWFFWYDAAMHKLWNWMAKEMWKNKSMTQNKLEIKWGEIYYPKVSKASIISRVNGGAKWHDPDRSLFITGAVTIKRKFDEWVKKIKNATERPGEEWSMPIGDHVLTGRIDLITEENGKRILWDLRFNNAPYRRNLRLDWEVTAAAAAYEYLFGKGPDRINIYEVTLNKLSPTRRIKRDFIELTHLVNQVASLIEAKIDYRAFGPQCESCNYLKSCKEDYVTKAKRKKGS